MDDSSLGGRFLTNLTFVETLFVILLGWILVALWQRLIDNFTFNTLGLNEDSAYHTFIIALVATIIFVIFIFTFPSIQEAFISGDESLTPPPIIDTTPAENLTPANASFLDDQEVNPLVDILLEDITFLAPKR